MLRTPQLLGAGGVLVIRVKACGKQWVERFLCCHLVTVMLILNSEEEQGGDSRTVPTVHPSVVSGTFVWRGKAGTPISLHRLGKWGEEKKTSPGFLFCFRKLFSKAHPLFPSCRLYLVLSSLGFCVDSSLPFPLQLIRARLIKLLSLC